jgi:hypothetical protein
MMHELAHCLDQRRDLPAFESGSVQVHSIAPVDAAKVEDIETFFVAIKKRSTGLWREALGDIFVVGFWRLTAPAEAEKLARHLQQFRSARTDDPTHATTCWIEYAILSNPPISARELLAWADDRRSTAPCAIKPDHSE